MLPTTAQFDAAVDANTTEADCKVEIEREFNAVAQTINVTADHAPVDHRFHKDNVVNIRNPQRNGVAYGPIKEFFPSDNPLRAFRLIDDPDFDQYRDRAYYIPVATGGTEKADLTVDYNQDYNMNCIEVRYENTRNSSTYYDNEIEVRVTPNGGGETIAVNTNMNSTGVTRIYWTGSSWSTSKSNMDPDGTPIRSVRLIVRAGSWTHQPRIMYFGGLHIVDASNDIIDVSVDKTEFEQSAHLPVGEPSGNSCSVTLDNTAQKYRFGTGLDRNFFLKNQRVIIQFGINTKYGEGADSFEYVAGGTYYIDNFGYNEQEMTVNFSGQDYSKILQETFCGNYLWIGKSLKYIVHDVLARSGITPNGVIFDFGVSGNADETNKRAYTWSTDEQTVWDFLSTLAKSELGTVFYDEEENLVFTDRLDIDDKVSQGIQYTFDASVNLESIEEQFEVGANKIKVNYEELDANTTPVNVQLVMDGDGQPNYQRGPEVMLNQILWQPDGDESYLGSATLRSTLRPSDNYIYVTADTSIQITRDEGEVLIGDEFIKYNGVYTYSSGVKRLKIVERNARNTVFNGVVTTHKGLYSNYNLRRHFKYDRGVWGNYNMAKARTRLTPDGFRQYLHSRSNRYAHSIHCTEFESQDIDYNSNYRIYGMRFRFNEIPYSFIKDQAAGMYMNLVQSGGRGIFFEISNPDRPEVVRDEVKGNARAYKVSNHMNAVPMPPDDVDNLDEFKKTILYDEAQAGVDGDDGTYIDLTVIQEEQVGPDLIHWYVNGEYMGSFETEYSQATFTSRGFTNNEAIVGNTPTQKGRFGIFTRGSTDITVDFMYASNDETIGPDEVLQSKGFRKYFDSHRNTWNIKKQYLYDRPYYVEFGAPIHEVQNFEVDHDTFPNLYARIMNTDEESVNVFKASHDPFSSKLLVANSARIGIDLNNTVFYPDGTTLDHSFLIYGVGVIRAESDSITTSDSASIRRYGVQEVEMDNPWVNSKNQAISLATHIRKFWSSPASFFNLEVMPNPALQVRDRVNVWHPDKGFAGTSVWFVNGISLSYDGGLSSTVKLKRYEDYPTGDLDYREKGGIIIV